MKTLNTLVADIYKLLEEGEAKLDEEKVAVFAYRLHQMLKNRLVEERKSKGGLRMSNYGRECVRNLWYQVNKPEAALPLSGQTKLNFLIGDIVEELVLFLAAEAGHEVKGRQDELEVEGIKGHRDAVIDGVVVDVKSANSRSFLKFQNHTVPADDSFGYMDQLGLYSKAAENDPSVTVKGEAAFVGVDKERGQIAVDKYRVDRERDWASEIAAKRAILDAPEPPERCYKDEPDGAKGNRRLPWQCGYCQFRKECWPGARTFKYSNGLKHLTKVVEAPSVPEVH
jgi:hypothetical protein